MLAVVKAIMIASAFSAILVYAQELLRAGGPARRVFYGLSFGLAGLGAAALGRLADLASISTVYRQTPFLFAFGLLTALLPRRPGRGAV